MVTSFAPRVEIVNMAPSESERINRYREARDFYEGVQWLGRRRKNETRLTLNYARRLMQTAVAYMFAAPVTFDVPASASGGEDTDAEKDPASVAEQILAEYLGHIGADELDNQLALEASIVGDAVVKVTWDPVALLPVVTPVRADSVRVETRPDQPKTAIAWEHHYDMTADQLAAALPDHRVQIYGIPSAQPGSDAAQRVIEWWSADEWRVSFAGQDVLRQANPYGWMPYIPIVNNPTANEFWGSSDLRDLYDVCRELNTRYSVLADVLNLSGWPIAVLENVEGSDGITVGPGQKWELPQDAKAYLLDLLQGGGVKLHIEQLGEIRRAIHDLSETPRTSFGDSGRTISGAALEVEIQPLVQKVRRKRRGFDTYYRERNMRLLDLAERFGGVNIGGIRRVVAVWPSILPNDDDALATRLAQLTGSDNLAHRSAMAVWGIEDPEGEWKKLLEERTGIAATEPKPAFGEEGEDDVERDDTEAEA